MRNYILPLTPIFSLELPNSDPTLFDQVNFCPKSFFLKTILMNLRVLPGPSHYLTETDNSAFILLHILRDLEKIPRRGSELTFVERV